MLSIFELSFVNQEFEESLILFQHIGLKTPAFKQKDLKRRNSFKKHRVKTPRLQPDFKEKSCKNQ